MPSTPSTIYRTFQSSVAAHGARPAVRYRLRGTYASLTYAELMARVLAIRRALYGLGVRRGDRVAILSYNRPEWIVADLALQGLGAVTVPIYHTLPAQQVGFYLADSGAVAVFTEDARQTGKVTTASDNGALSSLRHVIQMSGEPPAESASVTFVSYSSMAESASDDPNMDADLDRQEDSISPSEVATFIYTSGTTGNPKGAMLSHTALLHTSWAARKVVQISEHDVFLSFLPLCHVVERVGGYYLPLAIGAEIVISEGLFALAGEIAEARPTAFICVPRVYDAMRERVMENVGRLPPLRRALARWALSVGARNASQAESGKGPGPIDALWMAMAERLVLRKIRQRVSGGQVRFLVSGGAPLHPDTGRFLQSIGLTVLEGYGLTEFPVISLNRPEEVRLGTVGHALPGVEVRLVETGEILVRGPSLMTGYHARPEATAEAIDAEGWLHTGDIGAISPDGRITITDRIKDIIVLANGKNVAPQPIESLLKQSALISEAVLFGDGQNSLVALIVPNFDELHKRRKHRQRPDINEASDEASELIRDPEVLRMFRSEINALSSDLADYEHIKQFRLLAHPFSIDNDELTPTMKVKRRIIAQRYADELASMLR